MKRDEKEKQIEVLAEMLKNAKAAFVADYRGVSVGDVTKLRADLRNAGVEYRVAKNTLVKLASKGTDCEVLNDFLTGPNAIAVSTDDPVAPAKILNDFAKANKHFELKAGVLGGKLLSAAEITALADLPSREVLLAKVLGSISAPTSNFVGLLAAVPRSLLTVLKAIEDQKAA